MSTVQLLLLVLVIGAMGFFAWANRATARAHAAFESEDVEAALAEALAPESQTHDRFDMFLAWPIRDAYLESVRLQCLQIIQETDPAPAGRDLSPEGEQRLARLLDEVRQRRSGGIL